MFLQYFDAGPSPSSATSTTVPAGGLYEFPISSAPLYVRPLAIYRDDNTVSNDATETNFRRFLGAPSQANDGGYYSVGDASTVTTNANAAATSDNTPRPFTPGNLYTNNGAAFRMADPNGSVDNYSTSNNPNGSQTTDGTNMQLPMSSTGDNSTVGRTGLDYTNTYNSSYSTLRMTNFNGNTTVRDAAANNMLEVEWQFKIAYDPSKAISATNMSVIPGHRYFFRLRGAGSQGLFRSGFSSPDGNSYGVQNVYYNGTSYSVNYVGDYRGVAPMAYLDIDPDIVRISLPVTYAKPLTATLNNGKVDLLWQSAVEIGNKGYNVLAGTTASNLKQIDFVPSKAHNGNSGSGYSYQSQDKAPVNNTMNYYRLQQIDLDGTPTLSDIVSVFVSGSNNGVKLMPNPVIGDLTISNIKVGSDIKIIGAGGQVVKAAVASTNIFKLNGLGSLPSGIYMVVVTNLNGKTETHKIYKK